MSNASNVIRRNRLPYASEIQNKTCDSAACTQRDWVTTSQKTRNGKIALKIPV